MYFAERTEDTKRRENIIVAIVFCGGIPFILYKSHPWVWVLLKVYAVTALGLGYILFIKERATRREKWFWKAMLLRVIPIHAVCMAALVYLNFRWIDVPIRPLVSYFILFIVFVVELSYLLAQIDKFRPPSDSTIPSTPESPIKGAVE